MIPMLAALAVTWAFVAYLVVLLVRSLRQHGETVLDLKAMTQQRDHMMVVLQHLGARVKVTEDEAGPGQRRQVVYVSFPGEAPGP